MCVWFSFFLWLFFRFPRNENSWWAATKGRCLLYATFLWWEQTLLGSVCWICKNNAKGKLLNSQNVYLRNTLLEQFLWDLQDVMAVRLKVFMVMWLSAFYLRFAVDEDHVCTLLLLCSSVSDKLLLISYFGLCAHISWQTQYFCWLNCMGGKYNGWM